ncbi:hypothetical protein [Lentisalinibacter salinarum]|uniref:hypothetical protein n=1 Tax=Lentisalinibacter salinarum TaxID=2992239 RepID=UPI003866D661
MIVQVSNERRIKGGERAWELQRPRVRKGKTDWESFKWFNSFGSALESAVREEIRLHPAQTLTEAIEAVSGVVRRYNALIPGEYLLRPVNQCGCRTNGKKST